MLSLAVGLVVATLASAAVAFKLTNPHAGWATAVALGAIVAPTDALHKRSLPPPAKIHAPWPHSSVRVAAGRDRPAWSVQGQTCAAMSGQRWKHEARRADLGA